MQRLFSASPLFAILTLAACGGGAGGLDDAPDLRTDFERSVDAHDALFARLDALPGLDRPPRGGFNYEGSVKFSLDLPGGESALLVGSSPPVNGLSVAFAAATVKGYLNDFHSEAGAWDGSLLVDAAFSDSQHFSGGATGALTHPSGDLTADMDLDILNGQLKDLGENNYAVTADIAGGATIEGGFYAAEGDLAAQYIRN